jgi:hypothetical protein
VHVGATEGDDVNNVNNTVKRAYTRGAVSSRAIVEIGDNANSTCTGVAAVFVVAHGRGKSGCCAVLALALFWLSSSCSRRRR